MAKKVFNIFKNGQIADPDLINENFLKAVQDALLGFDGSAESEDFDIGNPVNESICKDHYVTSGKQLRIIDGGGSETGAVVWDDIVSSAGGRYPPGYIKGGVPNSPENQISQYTEVNSPTFSSSDQSYSLNGSNQYIQANLGATSMSNNTFDLYFEVEFSDSGTIQGIFGLNSNAEEFIRIQRNAANKIELSLSSNGTSWDIADTIAGLWSFTAGKYRFWLQKNTGSGLWALNWYNSGWQNDINISSAAQLNDPGETRIVEFGRQSYGTDRYLNGKVYIENTYLVVGTTEVIKQQVGNPYTDVNLLELKTRGIDDLTNIDMAAETVDTGSTYFVPYSGEVNVSASSSYAVFVVNHTDNFDQYVLINSDAIDPVVYQILKTVRLKTDAITAIEAFTARTINDYRYTGSLLTNSSTEVIEFDSTELAGGSFYASYRVKLFDVNHTASTTPTISNLTVPTGISVEANLRAALQISGTLLVYAMITELDQPDTTPDANSYDLKCDGVSQDSWVPSMFRKNTGVTGQIRDRETVTSAAYTIRMWTDGYTERRG